MRFSSSRLQKLIRTDKASSQVWLFRREAFGLLQQSGGGFFPEVFEIPEQLPFRHIAIVRRLI